MFDLHLSPDIVLLIARLSVAIVMIYYGYPKIKDLKSNAEDFVGMGFKPGMFWGTIVALLEFFGGILLFLGALTPLIATLFGFEMLVGLGWKTTKTDKKFPGYSYDLLLLTLCLMLITFGGGVFALSVL